MSLTSESAPTILRIPEKRRPTDQLRHTLYHEGALRADAPPTSLYHDSFVSDPATPLRHAERLDRAQVASCTPHFKSHLRKPSPLPSATSSSECQSLYQTSFQGGSNSDPNGRGKWVSMPAAGKLLPRDGSSGLSAAERATPASLSRSSYVLFGAAPYCERGQRVRAHAAAVAEAHKAAVERARHASSLSQRSAAPQSLNHDSYVPHNVVECVLPRRNPDKEAQHKAVQAKTEQSSASSSSVPGFYSMEYTSTQRGDYSTAAALRRLHESKRCVPATSAQHRTAPSSIPSEQLRVTPGVLLQTLTETVLQAEAKRAVTALGLHQGKRSSESARATEGRASVTPRASSVLLGELAVSLADPQAQACQSSSSVIVQRRPVLPQTTVHVSEASCLRSGSALEIADYTNAIPAGKCEKDRNVGGGRKGAIRDSGVFFEGNTDPMRSVSQQSYRPFAFA